MYTCIWHGNQWVEQSPCRCPNDVVKTGSTVINVRKLGFLGFIMTTRIWPDYGHEIMVLGSKLAFLALISIKIHIEKSSVC
jgi:hypothetical protein